MSDTEPGSGRQGRESQGSSMVEHRLCGHRGHVTELTSPCLAASQRAGAPTPPSAPTGGEQLCQDRTRSSDSKSQASSSTSHLSRAPCAHNLTPRSQQGARGSRKGLRTTQIQTHGFPNKGPVQSQENAGGHGVMGRYLLTPGKKGRGSPMRAGL